jgi:hypothetical protein
MSRYYQSRNYNEAPAAQKQSYGGTSYGKTNTSQNYGTSQHYGRGGRNENDEESLMRSLFSTFDNDGDGHISQPEFLKMLSSLGYTISSQEVTQLVNSFDQNGDGEMDYTEFMNMVKYLKSKGYEYGKEALENKIRKAFRYVWGIVKLRSVRKYRMILFKKKTEAAVEGPKITEPILRRVDRWVVLNFDFCPLKCVLI